MSTSKLKLVLLAITIRRDAQTITPTTVPQHELRLLTAIHGKEQIIEQEDDAGHIELDPSTEYERLAKKYGIERVVSTFGETDDNLIAAIERNALNVSELTDEEKQAVAEKKAVAKAAKDAEKAARAAKDAVKASQNQ